MIYAIAAGGSCEFLFLGLSSFMLWYDEESGLSNPSYMWIALSYFMSFLAALSGGNGIWVVLCFSYLTFSAYTDQQTKYLYTSINHFYFLLGLVILLGESNSCGCMRELFLTLTCFVVWVGICRLLSAINSGDVELLLGMAVWILVITFPVLKEKDRLQLLFLLSKPIAVYILGSLLAFLFQIRKCLQKKEKRVAFAPYVLVGSLLVILGTYLFPIHPPI